VHSGGVPQPQKGDPFRVDAGTVRHPGVLRTPRLLSGDAFSVFTSKLLRPKPIRRESAEGTARPQAEIGNRNPKE